MRKKNETIKVIMWKKLSRNMNIRYSFFVSKMVDMMKPKDSFPLGVTKLLQVGPIMESGKRKEDERPYFIFPDLISTVFNSAFYLFLSPFRLIRREEGGHLKLKTKGYLWHKCIVGILHISTMAALFGILTTKFPSKSLREHPEMMFSLFNYFCLLCYLILLLLLLWRNRDSVLALASLGLSSSFNDSIPKVHVLI